MTEHFKLNNPDSYNEEYEKYFSGKISRKKLKQNIRDKVIEHMGDNLPVSIETYDECLSKYNIDVLRVKP